MYLNYPSKHGSEITLCIYVAIETKSVLNYYIVLVSDKVWTSTQADEHVLLQKWRRRGDKIRKMSKCLTEKCLIVVKSEKRLIV